MEWRAALEVLNLDDRWMQTGVICQEMHRFANAHSGSDAKPPKLEVFNPSLLVFGKPPVEQKKKLTVKQMHAEAAKDAGF